MRALLLVASCGFLAWIGSGCSPAVARPPKELTEQVICEKIKNESDGCIKLVSFTITKPESSEVKTGI